MILQRHCQGDVSVTSRHTYLTARPEWAILTNGFPKSDDSRDRVPDDISTDPICAAQPGRRNRRSAASAARSVGWTSVDNPLPRDRKELRANGWPSCPY